MKNLNRGWLLPILLLFLTGPSFAQDENAEKIRSDRQRFESNSDWIYNDLDQALFRAAETNKPIMVVLRCIPCEECVQLDDELLDSDPTIARLMEEFVQLRLTSTNGLDLNVFQYDTDQSFAVLFLNADKTVYGRFGTRSHRTEWASDVSVAGMALAMQGALGLHEQYPSNREQLLPKSNQATEFDTPESFPSLRQKPSSLDWDRRDYAEVAAKNCIHCHEISEARVEFYWKKEEPIPDKILYPYPHPKAIGMILDPDHRALVSKVIEESPADKAGLIAGDEILRMNDQPLLSIADVQWVLHHLPDTGSEVEFVVRRQGDLTRVSMDLESGWRKAGDTTWRTGHWILRRSMLGGMKLSGGSDTDESSDLVVEYAGTWGPFGAAHRAGVRQGDVITSVDGRSGFARESDLFEYINNQKEVGDQIRMTLSRDGRELSVRYTIQ